MRVCVYASSSPKTSSAFVAQGRRLGRLLAERGHVLINGGGKYGGMGALNEGCRAAGGVIECVIHEMFVVCLLYTSPSPRDKRQSRMPSSA